MRLHWSWALLVGATLTVGCNSQTPQDTQDPAAVAPAATEPAAVPPAPPVPPAPEPPPASVVDTAKPAPRTPSAPSRPTARAVPSTPAPAPAAPPAAAAPAPAPAAPPPPPPPPAPVVRDIRVPANTALPLELMTALSSESTTVETPVRARLKQSISVDGYNILPAGTVFSGTVTEVQKAGRVKGRARVAFLLTDAMVGGAKETVKTNPIIFEGEASRGEDAAKIGAGAGIGAVIGGILGGGSGAAKGAAIGGAAGTGAVLATRGQQVNIAEGADIAAVLTDSLTIQVTSK